nr:hypothetical protein [Mesorhizobium sp.]
MIGVLWVASLTAAVQAQDIDPVAALGEPDMGSARVVAIDGKVLAIAGIGSATTGAAQALKDAADALARQNAALTVRADGLDLRVAMQGDILFAFDRSDIRPEAEPTLTALAQMIAASQPAAIVVEGHTDAKRGVTHTTRRSRSSAQRPSSTGWWRKPGNRTRFSPHAG